MGRIIVLGSINMDVLVTTERHPQLGETVFGNDVHFVPGGKGANQAVAARRLDGEAHLIGRLGDDGFGHSLHEFLSSEQINLENVRKLEGIATGTALITVNNDSENTIVVVSGANKSNIPANIETISIQPDDIIVSQFEVPQETILALFQRADRIGATTILNAAPAQIFIEGLSKVVSHLIVNETELAFLSKQPLTEDRNTLIAMMRSLLNHPSQTIILTLGKAGALVLQNNDVTHVDGLPVHAVDTTGAGDCFVGALAVALSERVSLSDALYFANKAASLSVQKLGATTSMPYRDDLK